jgi:hypothetical protein
MHKLVVNGLYLFSIKEKRAKYVSFSDGINIISSSKDNGTKRGKSVIMKSIYHTLGADCMFEDKWNINDKVSILDFSVDKKDYYVLRYQRLFKIYRKDNLCLLFRTNSRTELADFFGELFKFKVMLPNKISGEIEITPPAYNYILNFIDQDGMDGSKFLSFASLQQYSDYKDKVLYYHFGVYNEEYYFLVRSIELIESNMKEVRRKIELNQNMVRRINVDVKDVDYSTSLQALEEELKLNKAEYARYVSGLSKCKKQLIKYRNAKEDVISSIEEILTYSKEIEDDVKSIIKHKCPYCQSEIEDNLDMRIYNYNSLEDALFLKAGLEEELAEIEHKIKAEEKKYQEQLEQINSYEKKLTTYNEEISDVLKYKGYMEMRDSLIKELGELVSTENTYGDELKKEKKKRKKYDDSKKQVNQRYYELMTKDKQRFGLKEISDKKLMDIKLNISAGGSNKPITTVIWYMNLLKIKKEFNPNAILFPIVFDSPNNVETDDEKRIELLRYLFESVDPDTQLIISNLGFDRNQFKNANIKKIIEITNDKYQLLNQNDYDKYKTLFTSLMENDM